MTAGTPPHAPRIPHRALLVLVGLLALQQALLWYLYALGGGKRLLGDENYYIHTARSILAGGPWQTSPIWPPGQGLFIAAILRLVDSPLAVQLVQSALFLGCGLLLVRLWRRVGGNRGAACAAAALFLLNPSNAAYAQYFWPEIPHLFAMLLGCVLLLGARERTAGSGAAAFGGGLAIGSALLLKSVLTGFWPLFLLCFVDWPRRRLRWLPAGAYLLGLGLCVAPALVGGHRLSGHWSIANSSAVNLLIGLEDTRRSDYVPGPSAAIFDRYLASGRSVDERRAWAAQQIREKLAAESLPRRLMQQAGRQYFRLFNHKTLLLSQLQGERTRGYTSSYAPAPVWLEASLRGWANLAHALTLIGFAFGLAFTRDWRSPGRWLLLALLGYQLALYLGLHVKARYLLPLVPVLCGYAGDGLMLAWASLRGELERPTHPRLRLCLGALLALLLSGLAFLGDWMDLAGW